MYFFTSDEHYDHNNIIKYCDRPFNSVHEMDGEIIRKHNEIVGKNDIVVHAGDFTLAKKPQAENYVRQLNGTHIFLSGSHDRWLGKNHPLQIWEHNIEGQIVVVCHYAMRNWSVSHYNSWQLFGHSHGTLDPIGKQWDIGVDNNDFYPVSFEQLKKIMAQRPDNFNILSDNVANSANAKNCEPELRCSECGNLMSRLCLMCAQRRQGPRR